MKKRFSMIATLTTVLAACGSIESDFIDLINAGDDRDICISQKALGVAVWKLNGKYYLAEVKPDQFLGDKNQVMALEALKANGYVSTDAHPFTTRTTMITTDDLEGYAITNKGAEYFRPNESVCIGERAAKKVIEYTKPAEQGGMTVSMATFAYEIEFNDLIKELDIEQDLRNSEIGDYDLGSEGKAVFVETNRGWRLEDVMW